VKIEEIERLIELVARNDIDSLELKTGGVEIRISKDRRWAAAAAPSVPHAPSPPAAAPPVPATAAEPDEEAGLHLIRASMVGTFYRSPNPGAPPFVEVGDTVRKGQVLCILEAMKIMNEVECDVDGKVIRVYPEDRQPVEFGERLFALAPL
jgi:acetyl-CoA carboxylase biotin carboxyl carrier protein